MSFFAPLNLSTTSLIARSALLTGSLALAAPACGGNKFESSDGVTGGEAGAGVAGMAGQGGVAGVRGSGGVAGMVDGGTGGVAGAAGVGGRVDGGMGGVGAVGGVGTVDGGTDGSTIMPDPNDQPLIARPELNQTFYGPRIYVRAEPGPNQVAAQILSYEICYGFGDPTEITASPDCPASAMRLSTTTGTAALLVLDDERRSSGEKVRDYFIKARAVKSDSTNPLSAWSEVRQVTSDLSFLVALYTFDEDIGNTQQVTDFSGNGNHGVLISDNADATQVGTEINGQALMLDGQNDYVDLTQSLANLTIDSDSDYSVEVRYRVDNLNLLPVPAEIMMYSLNDSTDLLPEVQMAVTVNPPPVLGARFFDGNNSVNAVLLPLELLVLQVFQQSIITYSEFTNGRSLALYHNGEFSFEGMGTTPAFTGAQFDVVSIGAQLSNGVPTKLFIGAFDELAVYKAALTEPQIVNNYCAATEPHFGGLPPPLCLN